MIHLSEVVGDTSGPIGKQVTVTFRGRSAVALYDGGHNSDWIADFETDLKVSSLD
ncbi:hypothetical protein [Paraburkholderia hospita]|uniref:hypothetical protein n=1 Tax=Paraburkholderia hospita TaxID=169430 RepID=UPI001FC9A54A|nr:hypothetical protein [Paraburkholderia hospita]